MHQEQYWVDQGRKNVSKPYVAFFFKMWVNELTKIIKSQIDSTFQQQPNPGWSQWDKQVHSTYASLSFPLFCFQSMITVKLHGMILIFVNSQTPLRIDRLYVKACKSMQILFKTCNLSKKSCMYLIHKIKSHNQNNK